jgi:hypothetical protein
VRVREAMDWAVFRDSMRPLEKRSNQCRFSVEAE